MFSHLSDVEDSEEIPNTDINQIEFHFLKKYGDNYLNLQSGRPPLMPLVVKFLPLHLIRKEEEEAEMNRNLRIKTLKYIESSSPHPRLPGAGDYSEVSSIVDENMSTVTEGEIKAGDSATNWKNYKSSEILKKLSVISLKTVENCCPTPDENENVLDLDQELMPFEYIPEKREERNSSFLNTDWTDNFHFVSDLSLWTVEDFCNALANIFLGSLAIAVLYKLRKRNR